MVCQDCPLIELPDRDSRQPAPNNSTSSCIHICIIWVECPTTLGSLIGSWSWGNWPVSLGYQYLPPPNPPSKVPNFNFHHPSISCTTCRERKSVSGTSDTWGSIAFLGASPVEIPITIKTSWWTGKPDPDQASQSEFLKLVQPFYSPIGNSQNVWTRSWICF